jgi:hypothetical protein
LRGCSEEPPTPSDGFHPGCHPDEGQQTDEAQLPDRRHHAGDRGEDWPETEVSRLLAESGIEPAPPSVRESVMREVAADAAESRAQQDSVAAALSSLEPVPAPADLRTNVMDTIRAEQRAAAAPAAPLGHGWRQRLAGAWRRLLAGRGMIGVLAVSAAAAVVVVAGIALRPSSGQSSNQLAAVATSTTSLVVSPHSVLAITLLPAASSPAMGYSGSTNPPTATSPPMTSTTATGPPPAGETPLALDVDAPASQLLAAATRRGGARLELLVSGRPNSLRRYALSARLLGDGVIPPAVPLVSVPRSIGTSSALATFLVRHLDGRRQLLARYDSLHGSYRLVFSRRR